MNERIRQLAEQAKAQSFDLSDASVFKRLGLVEAVVFTPEDLEKFAQLIVRECIDVIGEDNYTMLTGKAYCTELKRHFGVKE